MLSRPLRLPSLLLLLAAPACSTNSSDPVGTVHADAAAPREGEPSSDDDVEGPGAPSPSGDDAVDFGPGSTPVAVDEPTPDPGMPDPVAMPDPVPVDDGSPNAANPLQACASAVATGSDRRIDDFDDRDEFILEHDGRSASWYNYSDEAGTGTLVLEWLETAGPASGVTGALHAQSSGFPEFSGIGVGLRWTETGSEYCTYDASYYEGLSFWAKGSGSLRVALQNPSVRPVAEGGTCPADASCYDSHGLDITLTSEWTHHRVGFSGVKQAGWGTPVGAFVPSDLFTIEFQFPPAGTVDLLLDDLAFYRADDPPEPEPVEPEPVEPEPIEPEPLPADGGVPDPMDAGFVADGGSTEPLDAAVETDAGL